MDKVRAKSKGRVQLRRRIDDGAGEPDRLILLASQGAK